MPCPYCNHDDYWELDNSRIVCRGCGREMTASRWTGKMRRLRVRLKYRLGQHGAKGSAQKKYRTSGKTHQSEHVVGYEVFGRGAKRGKSQFAKLIENLAAAYQEELDSHRGHIGTGSWKDYRGTGESSDHYRELQRMFLRRRMIGVAVQLNQLYYSMMKEFRSKSKSKQLEVADKSFEEMVKSFPEITTQIGDEWKKIGVTDIEKVEMSLSRLTARRGSYPSKQEELEAMKRFGILPGGFGSLKTGLPFSLQLDRHGIPKDGNCLFHSIHNRLANAGRDMSTTTSDDLRRQAVGYLRNDFEIQQLGIVDYAYAQMMAQSGTWGGELEVLALAHVWGVEITVIGPGYRIVYNQGRTTQMAIYYDGVGHYSVGPL